jgi:hypothetical protein
VACVKCDQTSINKVEKRHDRAHSRLTLLDNDELIQALGSVSLFPLRLIATNRPTGDLSHLASIFILLRKIQTSRSCRGLSLGAHTRTHSLNVASTGISFKTQALYTTVFVTRYLDLFSSSQSHSLYNIVMKIFFICSSVYVLFLMKVRFRYVAI